MTTTLSTEHAAFCRAVRAGDEVARLVYADWLEERPAVRECPKCKGAGYRPRAAFEDPGSLFVSCEQCQRSGTVTDATDNLRGKLIRVQCEVARVGVAPKCETPSGYVVGSCDNCGDEACPAFPWHRRRNTLRARESALTAALDRARPPCPVCDNGWLPKSGTPDPGMASRCAHCKGAGRVGEWRGGMLWVPVPRLEAVWQVCPECTGGTQWQGTHCDSCRGTGRQPTPWAGRLRAECPWVEGVPALDREPLMDYGDHSGLLRGRRSFDWERASSRPLDAPDLIPDALFDAMAVLHPGRVVWIGGAPVLESDTPGAAKDALARAASLALFSEGSIPPAAEPG